LQIWSNNSFSPPEDVGGFLSLRYDIYFSAPSPFLLIYHTGMINPTGDLSEVITFVSSIMNTVPKSTIYAEKNVR